MANLPEVSNFDSVYQIETTDLVQGGSSGTTNVPLKNLTNRTRYLKDHVDALELKLGGQMFKDMATANLIGDPVTLDESLFGTFYRYAVTANTSVTLPDAGDMGENRAFGIAVTSSNSSWVNLLRAGSNTILFNNEALTTLPIYPGEVIIIVSNGSHWEVVSAFKDASPTGEVIAFATSTAPLGYLKCNGAAVSRTAYARLFGIIGTTFGAGDGSTTFNLPDLRGRFVRGFDDGAGNDPSFTMTGTTTNGSPNITSTDTKPMVVGMTVTGTGIPANTTILSITNGGAFVLSNNATASGTVTLTFSNRPFGTYQQDTFQQHFHLMKKNNLPRGTGSNFFAMDDSGVDGSENTENAGYIETRPRNVSLLYCIKF